MSDPRGSILDARERCVRCGVERAIRDMYMNDAEQWECDEHDGRDA